MRCWLTGVLLSGAALVLCACAASVEPGHEPASAGDGARDGSGRAQVRWTARTLWESDATVWSLLVADLLPRVAGLEVVAMDDKGRGALLETRGDDRAAWWLTMDGLWLGAAAWGDVDPTRCGNELYLAGGRGNVYQVVPLVQGGFDCRAVWFVPDEIHALLVDDVVPHHPGPDLLACTLQGKIFHLLPGAQNDLWRGELLHQETERVRNTVAFDFVPGLPGKEILYVSRAGRLGLLGWRGRELEERIIHQAGEGLARVALGAARAGEPPPVYTAGDDGRIVRHVLGPSGAWQSRVIHECPAEARGVAAGRFTGDPGDESVAVFGYSGEVVLLVRKAGEDRFSAATIFTDSDKGHWLTAANLDPRNDTDEILICGYSGRVVFLLPE